MKARIIVNPPNVTWGDGSRPDAQLVLTPFNLLYTRKGNEKHLLITLFDCGIMLMWGEPMRWIVRLQP